MNAEELARADVMSFNEITIGSARLIHGDCREVLPMLPECDLILTDPPYGIGEAAGKNKSRSTKNIAARDYGDDDWDNELTADWVIELMRVKAKRQIIFGGNYYKLPPTKCWLVWDKDNTGDFADCELAWTNLPKAVRRLRWRWNGMLQQDMARKETREHPTQKPLSVIRWALMQAPNGMTVCDPFMGVGTTGVACFAESRRFVGIERERKYFDIACERIEQAQAQGQLLPPEQPEPAQQHSMELSPNT